MMKLCIFKRFIILHAHGFNGENFKNYFFGNNVSFDSSNTSVLDDENDDVKKRFV